MATVINGTVAPLTPPNRDIEWKWASVARTDTSAKTLCFVPKGATIVAYQFQGTLSDAGTTATLDVGTSADADAIIDATDVLTVAGAVGVPAVVQSELTADTKITGTYTESGTASTAGGDWHVGIGYVRNMSGHA
jgi:hypothetical protein